MCCSCSLFSQTFIWRDLLRRESSSHLKKDIVRCMMHTVHQKSIEISARGTYSSFRRSEHRGRTVGGIDIRRKKIRDPQIIIIRNKFTKEVVDLEVSVRYTTKGLVGITPI